MSAPSPLYVASQSLTEAQGLLAAIRANAAIPTVVCEPLSQLEELLQRTQAQLADAQGAFQQLSDKFEALSSMVVSSNIRHF